MEKKFRNTENRYYVRMDSILTVDYDDEPCLYERWHEFDAETGEFLRYVFICAKDAEDTPETVDWDWTTKNPQLAWMWYYEDGYKADPFI